MSKCPLRKLLAMKIQRMLLRKNTQISWHSMRKLGELSKPMTNGKNTICDCRNITRDLANVYLSQKVDPISIFCALERTILNLEDKARQIFVLKRCNSD